MIAKKFIKIRFYGKYRTMQVTNLFPGNWGVVQPVIEETTDKKVTISFYGFELKTIESEVKNSVKRSKSVTVKHEKLTKLNDGQIISIKETQSYNAKHCDDIPDNLINGNIELQELPEPIVQALPQVTKPEFCPILSQQGISSYKSQKAISFCSEKCTEEDCNYYG